MRAVVRKVFQILTPSERRRGGLVIVLMTFVALVDVAGIASIAPFLAVFANPEVVTTNPWLARAYEAFGFEDRRSFLFALGLVALVLLVGTSVFRALVQYALIRYSTMRQHSIGRRLLEGHLRQPYAFFLERNSSALVKTIFSEVGMFVQQCLKPLGELVGYAIAALAIVVLLVVVDPWLALAVLGGIGGFYTAVYFGMQGWLGRLGRARAAANVARFRLAGEALGGVKELRVLGRERQYLDAFSPHSERFARSDARAQIGRAMPRFAVEGIGFVGVIGLMLWFVASGAPLGEVLPVLGVYAMAGYRLLPAAQRTFNAITTLRFGGAAADAVLADLNRTPAAPAMPASPVEGGARERLPLTRVLELDGVTFAYQGAGEATLKGVDLTVPANATVGIVGATGAGKSTLVDVILGLLTPERGEIRVDGKPLDEANVRAWLAGVGYVPQHIFLADDTVARNIAFGVPEGEIDHAAVERAARMAHIHEFVTGELPHGYATVVGERGVRLSGGQRQRLGIARALYRDPEILILDEATSALDMATEAAVMRAVGELAGTRTILMIAHRLDTLRRADMVVELAHGRVAWTGTFEEVVGARTMQGAG